MPEARRSVSLLSFTVLIAAFATLATQTASTQTPVGPDRNPQPSASQAQSDAQQQPATVGLYPQVHYESVNDNETWGGGDKLALPRLIAAAVVAQDYPAPRMVVDVGSHQGEFLEAFMEKFPAARGQWTEPVTKNEANARARLARFGDRVDYRIGCPNRNISDVCVPKTADVIITSWVTAHQELDGVRTFYQRAAAQLPPGGWLVNLDHIGFGGSAWEHRFKTARLEFEAAKQGPARENGVTGPVPTVDEELAAFKAAGFDDVEVVWRSFTTCLFVAHKR